MNFEIFENSGDMAKNSIREEKSSAPKEAISEASRQRAVRNADITAAETAINFPFLDSREHTRPMAEKAGQRAGTERERETDAPRIVPPRTPA